MPTVLTVPCSSPVVEQLPSPIVVRVVSRKRFIFPAPKELRQRYGANYAFEFPYLCQALFAFQKLNGRDVLCGG